MVLMASTDGVREWVHSFVADQGTLAEIIKSTQQGLEAVTRSINIVEDGFHIESTLGLSLDALGALFGHKRQEGLGDNDYRNQLLTLVEDSTTQSIDVIKETVEWISGYTPTVEEPDPGTIMVRLPINKTQYSADVYAQLNRVKAAGVRVIVGHLEEFFESFSEILLVTDHIFSMLRGMFYDSFADPWPLIGGSGQWDWGNWDTAGAKWDSSDTPSDSLFIWWTQKFVEAYSDTNWDDVLFLIGISYLVETFSTYSDSFLLDGVFYFPETITSFLDSLGLSGILFFPESINAAAMTDIINAIRIAFVAETFTGLVDVLGFDGILYQKDSMLNWPLIGGVGQWDWGSWDGSSAYWDSSTQPSDILVLSGVQAFIESIAWADIDEELMFLGIMMLVETLGVPTEALFFDGVLYRTESYAAGNLVDNLGYSGLLVLAEALSPALSDEDLYFEGVYYFTEALLASALDELLTIGPWFEEIWRPFGWDKGQWDIDSWDQDIARDILEFILGKNLTDSYSDTNWDDEIYFEGILYETDPYVAGNLVDDLDFVGILYETESLGTPAEDLEFIGILYEVEAFSSYSDALDRIGQLNLVDPLTSFYTESIYFEGVYYPTETLLSSAIVDAFSSNVPFMEFADSKTNVVYSKIGTAKIGTAKIGPALRYDPSTNTLIIKEVMK